MMGSLVALEERKVRKNIALVETRGRMVGASRILQLMALVI
jgi:hypothetical protein